jgi:hypothetical protein
MRRDTPDSGPDSGAMCRTENQHPPSSKTNECGFLADREADAKTAIGRRLCDMKETLTQMADVRSCAARHPWILTGSAVAVGIVAGVVLTPSAGKKMRTTQGTPLSSTAEAPPASRAQEAPRATKSFLFSIAATVLAAALRPLFQSLFASAVAPQGESRGAPSSRDSTEFESGVD